MQPGKVILLFLGSILALATVYGQEAEIDSLKTLLRSAIHDTIKLQVLSDLNWMYCNTEPELAKKYGFQELKLATEIVSDKWIAQSYNDIGIAYFKHGHLDSALYCYEKSLIIRKTLNDNTIVASSFSKVGMIYMEQGNFNSALENFMNALKIYEETKNDIYLGMILNNIGVIYKKMNNNKKVIEYCEKAISIFLKIENEHQTALCYANIASVYYNEHDNKASNDYLKKALKIFIKYQDKPNEAAVLNSIGVCLRSEDKDDEALIYYKQAYDISVQINDKLSIGLYAHNLSGVYSDKGNYNKSEKYCIEALANTEPSNKYQLALIYRQLATITAFLNNGEKTKFYLDRYAELKDSIYSMESSNQIAEMETKYQTEKKDKELIIKDAEIVKQQADASKKAFQRNGILIGFIVILGFLFLLFRLFLQKKKAFSLLAQQNIEINQQKEEITAQRDQIESHRDKLSQQNHTLYEQKKEITDSINYAKRIQNAVLPAEQYANSILGEHFIIFMPKDVVSGDFYWATKVNDWLIVTAADCTGHGVPGAFMSMLGVSFLNEIVSKKEVTSAAAILNHLRASIIEALRQTGDTSTSFGSAHFDKLSTAQDGSLSGLSDVKDGMDMSIIAIHVDRKRALWAGANNPLWIIRSPKNLSGLGDQKKIADQVRNDADQLRNDADQVRNDEHDHAHNEGVLVEVKADKMPVSVHIRMDEFTNHEIELNQGDLIYLFTDGYPDQFGGKKGKKFKYKPFQNLLLENSSEPMAAQKLALEIALNKWQNHPTPSGNKSYEQIDDITLVGLKI